MIEPLKAAFLNFAGFEAKDSSVTDTRVRLLGRVAPEAMETWLRLVSNLLMQAGGASWTLDISKSYFLRGERLMYGWRVLIQAAKVEEVLPSVIATIRSSRVAPQVAVQEVPLNYGGASHDGPRGKGARPVGSKFDSGPRSS